MQRKLTVPKMQLRADVLPKTVVPESRTVEVTFSTGARVLRNSFFGMGEDFYEELDMKKSAIRLERFQQGAPVLKDHRSTLDSMIGVVESASVKDGVGVATLRFSERQEADQIFRDIQSGIIRNVSVGYRVHKIREMKADEESGIKVLRVTDWEPLELSFVTIPADAGARVRHDLLERFDCDVESEVEPSEINEPLVAERSEQAATETNDEGDMKVESQLDAEAVRKEAAQAERTRCVEIRKAVTKMKLEASFADTLIEKGVSVDEARAAIIEELASKQEKTVATNVEVGRDIGKESMKTAVADAILARHKPAKHKLNEVSAQFRYSSMLDLCRHILESQGVSTRGLSPMQIASRGLHSTSDFPEILANVANKTLRDAYSESAQTFSPFTRRVTVSDFKQISRTQLGDAPKLLKKLETGEYQHGTISEGAEKYAVQTYGRVVGVSREMLINDDLNAFARLPEMYGRQAANLESDLVWGEINSNPTMGDSVALFHASHGNLAAGGDIGAPSVATLGAAREAMRLQKSLDGSFLNIMPKYLMVPANLETVADQLTTQITPDQAGQVNPFGQNGKSALQSAAEPRLDATSVTAWYLFAGVDQIDVMELATLVGEEGPVVDSMIDFDTDGVKLKARHTVGVKAIDWRGMYKNPG